MTGGEDQKKPEDQTSPDKAAPGAIPEVEAEVVIDEAETAAPFEEDTPPAAATSEKAEKPAEAAKRSFVSPGVLFFAGLVIVSIAAGVYWYFTSQIGLRKSAKPAAVIENTAPAEDAPAAEQAPKVSNNFAEDAKDASANPSPIENAGAELPPPSDDVENLDLQDAKEATIENVSEDEVDEASDSFGFEIENTDSPNEEAAETLNEAVDEEDAVDPAAGTATEIPADEPAEPASIEDSISEGLPQPEESDTTKILPTDEPESLSEIEENLDTAIDIAEDNAAAGDIETSLVAEQKRVSELQASLEETQNELDSVAEALTTTQAERDAAESKATQLRSELAAAQDEAANLRARIAVLEEAASSAPLAASAVAVNAVNRAINTGAPFASELAALSEAAPDAPGLQILSPYAADGAPTLVDLQKSFAGAARKGLAVADRANAKGPASRFAAHAANLVSIRPAEPQSGTSPRSIISRAEAAVEEGALETAIAELQSLPVSAQDAMSEWIALAKERAAIDNALAALSASIEDQARG